MDTENEILWKSKTSGHRASALLLTCLTVLLLSLASLFIFSSSDNSILKSIILIIVGLAIIASIAAVCLTKLTDLKWDVSNLLFYVAPKGIYFTGVVRQDSYFHDSWSNIASYSVKMGRKGKATVTVNFISITDAGSYGNLKRLKMVGIEGVEELTKIFESYGINQIQYSKN